MKKRDSKIVRVFVRGASYFFLLPIAIAAPSPGPSPTFQMVQTQNGVTTVVPACGSAGGLRSCPEVIPSLIPQIKNLVNVNLEAAYAGVTPNPNPTPTPSPGASPPPPSVPSSFYLQNEILHSPICNLFQKVSPNPPGQTGEQPLNHLGQACGLTCQFNCHVLPPVAPATLGQVQCGYDPTTCAAERSWSRGALTQLVWVHYDEVVTALRNTPPMLTLSPRCEPAVNDPSFTAAFAKLNTDINLYLQVDEGRSISCDPGVAPTSPIVFAFPSTVPLPTASPEIARCLLSASRRGLESVIAELAVCEVFARADRDWATPVPQQFDSQVDVAVQSAMHTCITSAPAGLGPRPDRTNPPALSNWMIKCLNHQYGMKILDLYQNVVPATTPAVAKPEYTSAPNN